MSALKIWPAVSGGLQRFFRPFVTRPADRYASSFGVMVGGVAFVVFGLVFFSALISLWPAVETTGSASSVTSHHVALIWGLIDINVTRSTALLLLALAMGAIGGYVHAATSFVSYIGNREFKTSWGWWYALRAFIGASLALLVYLALRGGFLSGNSTTGDVNPYGVAAAAGLAGLFSKQATDKLEEIFNTAFHTTAGVGGDSRRLDTMASAGAPTIEKLSPNAVASRRAATVTIYGTGFTSQSAVRLDGVERKPTAWSTTTLTFQVDPGDYPGPRQVQVAVVNPEGRPSAPATLSVT